MTRDGAAGRQRMRTALQSCEAPARLTSGISKLIRTSGPEQEPIREDGTRCILPQAPHRLVLVEHSVERIPEGARHRDEIPALRRKPERAYARRGKSSHVADQIAVIIRQCLHAVDRQEALTVDCINHAPVEVAATDELARFFVRPWTRA